MDNELKDQDLFRTDTPLVEAIISAYERGHIPLVDFVVATRKGELNKMDVKGLGRAVDRMDMVPDRLVTYLLSSGQFSETKIIEIAVSLASSQKLSAGRYFEVVEFIHSVCKNEELVWLGNFGMASVTSAMVHSGQISDDAVSSAVFGVFTTLLPRFDGQEQLQYQDRLLLESFADYLDDSSVEEIPNATTAFSLLVQRFSNHGENLELVVECLKSLAMHKNCDPLVRQSTVEFLLGVGTNHSLAPAVNCAAIEASGELFATRAADLRHEDKIFILERLEHLITVDVFTEDTEQTVDRKFQSRIAATKALNDVCKRITRADEEFLPLILGALDAAGWATEDEMYVEFDSCRISAANNGTFAGDDLTALTILNKFSVNDLNVDRSLALTHLFYELNGRGSFAIGKEELPIFGAAMGVMQRSADNNTACKSAVESLSAGLALLANRYRGLLVPMPADGVAPELA